MNDLLAAVCSSQAGLFTSSDARRCGYTSGTLRTMERDGGCVRVTRGVYAAHAADLSAEDFHRRLTRAMLLRYDGRAMASHQSTLMLHGLPVHGVDLRRVQLTSRVGLKTRRGADYCLHRPVGGAAVEAEGWPSVHPAVALIQTAIAAGAGAAVVSADAALHRDLVSPADLAQARVLIGSRSGSRAAAVMLELADSRSESPGESRLRLGLVLRGIRVVPQVVIRDDAGRFVARVDLMVEGTKVIIEFDGMMKYRGVGGEQALIEEKLREDRLRSLGYLVIRITWRDLGDPGRIAARVRAAIAQFRAAA